MGLAQRLLVASEANQAAGARSLQAVKCQLGVDLEAEVAAQTWCFAAGTVVGTAGVAYHISPGPEVTWEPLQLPLEAEVD